MYKHNPVKHHKLGWISENQAVTVKNIIVRYLTPRSPVEVYRRFGGKYCLHLRGPRVFIALLFCLLFTLMMEAVRSTAGLHGNTSQKVILFYESIIHVDNEETLISIWYCCYNRRFGADQAYLSPENGPFLLLYAVIRLLNKSP
jgi:hypothetical protein